MPPDCALCAMGLPSAIAWDKVSRHGRFKTRFSGRLSTRGSGLVDVYRFVIVWQAGPWRFSHDTYAISGPQTCYRPLRVAALCPRGSGSFASDRSTLPTTVAAGALYHEGDCSRTGRPSVNEGRHDYAVRGQPTTRPRRRRTMTSSPRGVTQK
jgi:hypothetical protein